MITFIGKNSVWGEIFCKKIILLFYPPSKLYWNLKQILYIFNLKKWEMKILSQICRHFQTNEVESQNWPNWILQKIYKFTYLPIFKIQQLTSLASFLEHLQNFWNYSNYFVFLSYGIELVFQKYKFEFLFRNRVCFCRLKTRNVQEDVFSILTIPFIIKTSCLLPFFLDLSTFSK